jgi:hypothetical protein
MEVAAMVAEVVVGRMVVAAKVGVSEAVVRRAARAAMVRGQRGRRQ